MGRLKWLDSNQTMSTPVTNIPEMHGEVTEQISRNGRRNQRLMAERKRKRIFCKKKKRRSHMAVPEFF